MRYRTATFATLRDSASSRCDACGETIHADEDEAAGRLTGKGTYVWVRGGEVRREEVPLCSRCGATVGMTVLSRLAMEEEEG
jgi:ribosomal protein S27AE